MLEVRVAFLRISICTLRGPDRAFLCHFRSFLEAWLASSVMFGRGFRRRQYRVEFIGMHKLVANECTLVDRKILLLLGWERGNYLYKY